MDFNYDNAKRAKRLEIQQIMKSVWDQMVVDLKANFMNKDVKLVFDSADPISAEHSDYLIGILRGVTSSADCNKQDQRCMIHLVNAKFFNHSGRCTKTEP
ncbi:MAG TPA: hypothetical protein VHQ20_02040, partial [Patescibacteria group bacterium]|nr:hypothetical protein [Patescibacteria group bacterium]